MTNSQRIAERNDEQKVVGTGLAVIGVVIALFGAFYICAAPTASILASADDGVLWISIHAHEFCWIGAWMASLGTLLKWKAEDSQEAFEKTTRFVDRDELRELQASRR